MNFRLLLSVPLVVFMILSSIAACSDSSGATLVDKKTLLAIFAHPDDEIVAAPLLAKYAREGVTVQLAIVTDGQKGGNPGGEELKVIRAGEAMCSAAALGIEPPILMEFVDGEVGDNVNEVKTALQTLLAEIQPDVVVTWGPEGGYGHKDHRMVSAVVAGLVQAGVEGSPENLFFPGVPQSQIDAVIPISVFGTGIKLLWGATDEKYLPYHVPVNYEDVAVTYTAAACHSSQWSDTALVDINAFVDAGLQTVYLRKPLEQKEGVQTSLFPM